jgi:hypothetical protein
MSKKLLLATAVLTFAVLGSTFAAVNNIKVSGDINEVGVLRDMSMGDTLKNNNIHDADSFLISQVRLRIDADLTENVSAVVRLLNERMWGHEDTFSDEEQVDIDLAYLEMKEFLYQPLSVIVGRQELHYGSDLIVGDRDTNQTVWTTARSNWNFGDLSLKKSFDAVRAILDFSPYTIDLIYSKVQAPNTFIRDNVNLWGLNANYKWASYNGVTEAYYWFVENNKDGVTYTDDTTQRVENQHKTYVIGGRFQLDPTDQFTVGVEGAYQFGDVFLTGASGADADAPASPYQHLSAFAAELNAEYRFLTKYSPKLDLNYVYLSGDDDYGDTHHGGWDPMFENQSLGEIMNILFPNSNVQGVKLAGSIMPREDITLGLSYTWLRLAQKLSTTSTGANTTTYTPPVGPYSVNTYQVNRENGDLGGEIDAYALYDYTEDVQIKLTGGWFIPGEFFAAQNDDVAYSLKGGVTVNF